MMEKNQLIDEPNNSDKKHYAFYTNRKCEFFPCHKGADPENYNCLFCYCPLYALGKECGGNFRYMENGRKDCSNCMIPHRRECYEWILERCSDIEEIMK